MRISDWSSDVCFSDLRDEAPLAEQMAAALLELAHPGTAAAAEKDDRLGHHRAVLGETERQRVDPDAPGDVGGGAAEKCDGIGEARAVPVQPQSLALGAPADLADSPAAPHPAVRHQPWRES